MNDEMVEGPDLGVKDTVRKKFLHYTDKKSKIKFSSYLRCMGSGAKSYMRKGYLIYEEIYSYEEAVSHT